VQLSNGAVPPRRPSIRIPFLGDPHQLRIRGSGQPALVVRPVRIPAGSGAARDGPRPGTGIERRARSASAVTRKVGKVIAHRRVADPAWQAARGGGAGCGCQCSDLRRR
jgi:hypothetical protein